MQLAAVERPGAWCLTLLKRTQPSPDPRHWCDCRCQPSSVQAPPQDLSSWRAGRLISSKHVLRPAAPLGLVHVFLQKSRDGAAPPPGPKLTSTRGAVSRIEHSKSEFPSWEKPSGAQHSILRRLRRWLGLGLDLNSRVNFLSFIFHSTSDAASPKSSPSGQQSPGVDGLAPTDDESRPMRRTAQP